MAHQSFRFQVGAFACAVFADASSQWTEADLSRFFARDSDRVLAAFRALPAPPTNCINVLYVEAANRRILVDSGIGRLDKDMPGQLLTVLRAEAIPPESIDTVIITHFHMDHIGGLLNEAGQPAFPKARLVVPTPEYAYWMAEDRLAALEAWRAELLRKTFDTYAHAGGLSLMDDVQAIAPGICYVPAYGHTPGQCGVWLESQGEQLLHIADTAHIPFQLNLVDASPTPDIQPEVAIATRRATFERAEAEHLRLIVYHFPFPGIGHVERVADQRIWIPVAR